MRVNRSLRRMVDSEPAPDRGDEYHFYQAVLAAWPAESEEAPVPDQAAAELVERLRAYMNKAIREGKLHTSWINPNEAYEAAVDGFVQRCLQGDGASKFLPLLVPFARRLARLGMVNSLAQLVLKLVSPGVSDVYQGGELWDLSLVDPDNRRPVDYGHRRALLRELEPLLAAGDVAGPGERDESAAVGALVDRWHDGRIKMFVTAAGLRLRRARPEVFLDGTYLPVAADGLGADHVVACAREHEGALVLAIVPRLLASAAPHAEVTGPEAWRDTRLRLPDAWRGRLFRSVLTGGVVKPIRTAHDTWLMTSRALAACPVALLWSDAAWSTE
jgi:(1->4)-alpha-D-glucan 1-alpha-D-glucosylmutase